MPILQRFNIDSIKVLMVKCYQKNEYIEKIVNNSHISLIRFKKFVLNCHESLRFMLSVCL